MRKCIDVTHDILVGEKGLLNLGANIDNQIFSILNNQYCRDRYYLDNRNDIIKKAVEEWLRQRRDEFNIHNLEFRANLSPDEKLLASLFVEKQMEPEHYEGLSTEDLEKYLRIPLPKILQIVREFVNNGLLLINSKNGQDYYFAPLP